MNIPHYIGFDVHKKYINFCSKRANGELVEEGRLVAERSVLRSWAATRTYAWHGAMEATLFSGWIFDALKPYATRLEMAHPAMVKAIAAAKKKNDRIDAGMIADLLRCSLLPTCHVASPEIREVRRLLRYRQLVVRESVRMQNKMAGLLMEGGTPFEKEKLHGKKYFTRLYGIGEITALTWALEIGDPTRFSSCAKVMSYCGLSSALRSSADKQHYGSPFFLSWVMSLKLTPSHSQTRSTHQSSTTGGLFVRFTLRLSREPIPNRFACKRAFVAVRKSRHVSRSRLNRGGYTV